MEICLCLACPETTDNSRKKHKEVPRLIIYIFFESTLVTFIKGVHLWITFYWIRLPQNIKNSLKLQHCPTKLT